MAELDRILPSQHATANARHVRSPYSEQSTSSSSEPDTPKPTTSKPKLSDALSHLTFSPKRPRSPALPPRSASPAQPHGPARGRNLRMTTLSRPETQLPPRSHRVTALPPLVVCHKWILERVNQRHALEKSNCERKMSTRITRFTHPHLLLATRTSQD